MEMEERRYDYDLNQDSVVFDVGAYRGNFSALIYAKYACNIYAFEPISSFYNNIKFRIDKIKVFPYGLGATTRTESISVVGDASSIFISNESNESIAIRSFSEVIQELNIPIIDLLKINIEGCEYELLDHIIESGLSTRIRNIQVQFHSFFPDAETRRNAIREKLQETHIITYDYPFVWENHQLKT